MKIISAVATQQPEITKLAAREISIDVKTWSTSHRGPLLLVSATTPRIEPAGYAIAVAELIDCRPMTRDDEGRAGKATYPGAYAWVLSNVEPLQIFPVEVHCGLFQVPVPTFGLRTVKKVPIVPDGYRPIERVPASGHLRQARKSLGAAAAVLANARTGSAAAKRPELAAHPVLQAAGAAVTEIGTCLDTLIGQISGVEVLGSAAPQPQAHPLAPSLVLARPVTVEAQVEAKVYARARLDVLVVEGHVLVARAIRRLLCPLGEGHDVRTATSVEQALAEVVQREPDVLICDYDLGIESSARLLETLARAFPRVRRILYSRARPEIWRRNLDGRLVHHALVKPATGQQLLRVVAE